MRTGRKKSLSWIADKNILTSLFRRYVPLVAFVLIISKAQAQSIYKNPSLSTYCNPLNLDYRFSITDRSFREAADPMVVVFKGDYYLFASKSGGYWWSPDFRNWHFVTPSGIDIEKYAPAVFVINDTMYYTSSSNGNIYKTADPKSGAWAYLSHPHDWNDPWVFVDDDGKVYAYYGSAQNGTINCVRLDPNNKFKVIGKEITCIHTDTGHNGFEVGGDNNEGGATWTEGASMLKYNSKYYLTYATPGTQYRNYCDAYYVSDSPTGPFKLGANSPQTRRSSGFVTGTGHGGLFFDKEKKLWAITTACISKNAFFERRITLFPAAIDRDGYLHVDTELGDYPEYLPGTGHRKESTENLVGWFLLSRNKPTKASSVYKDDNPSNAVDENIKTSWSAASGKAGEWLQIDLQKPCTVNAIQSDFSEVQTTYHDGRKTSFHTRYIIEYSNDGHIWKTTVDKSKSIKDEPHDYVVFPDPLKARYFRITNKGDVPGYGFFALSDFRIFGKGNEAAPEAVSHFEVRRKADRRCANVSWAPVKNAQGYIIRYGISSDKLWNNYQVMEGNSFSIKSLITDQSYYFRIDTYNDSGITIGKKIIHIR